MAVTSDAAKGQLHVVFADTSRGSLRSNRKQIQNPITIVGGAWLGSSWLRSS